MCEMCGATVIGSYRQADRQTYDLVCKMGQADLVRAQVKEHAQQNGQTVNEGIHTCCIARLNAHLLLLL